MTIIKATTLGCLHSAEECVVYVHALLHLIESEQQLCFPDEETEAQKSSGP